MQKKKRETAAEKKLYEDYLGNKLLLIFLFALLGVAGIIFLQRFGVFEYFGISDRDRAVFTVLLSAGGAGMAGGAVWAALTRKKDTGLKLFTGFTLLYISAVVSVSALLMYYFFYVGRDWCYLFVIFAAVFAIVRMSMSREFYYTAFICGLSVIAFYMMHSVTGAALEFRRELLNTAYLVLCAGAAVFAAALFWTKGRLLRGKSGEKKEDFLPFLVVTVLETAMCAGALILQRGKVYLACLVASSLLFMAYGLYAFARKKMR